MLGCVESEGIGGREARRIFKGHRDFLLMGDFVCEKH